MIRKTLLAVILVVISSLVTYRIAGDDKTPAPNDMGAAMQAVVSTGELPAENPAIGSMVTVDLAGPTNTVGYSGKLMKLTSKWTVVQYEEGSKTSTVWLANSRIEAIYVKTEK
ncbi:MAG TPA: hypothetical protein VHS31_09730 [Tepidisphaeraceae bacterium]|nr:hypothetical protein [Tepidisphaeraceae bacterium]